MGTVYEKGFAIREWTNRPGYYVVDFQIDGRRIRKGCSSLDDAKTFCQQKRIEITNKGTEVLNLTEQTRKDALAAMKLLQGTGVSILAAAKDYVSRHPPTQGETIRQTCDRYLAAMQENKRRAISIYEKTLKFNTLCKTMGNASTAAVEELDIKAWAAGLQVGGATKDAYTGAGLSMLNFFRGKLKGRGSVDQKPPHTWGVTVVSDLFAKAEEFVPEIVPSLTVLFFAGVRPHEMMRLSWAEIDLAAKLIRLTGEQTKTRTMRNVDLSGNALAWLTAYQGKGLVVKSKSVYRRLQVKLMEKCKLEDWPTDVARHTFATMHYNAHQNAAATMAQLGHFGNPQTFVTHYKGVQAPAADVVTFWKILPTRKEQKQSHVKQQQRLVKASGRHAKHK